MEMWKDIPNYTGCYQVSNQGQVRSLDRVVPHARVGQKTVQGRVLKQALSGLYLTVCLCQNGRERTWRVGNLVLIAFVGVCPILKECCHNNGNPQDNKLSNLRYDTKSNNSKDAVKHGTHSGLQRKGKQVFATNKNIIFKDANDAANFIGCVSHSVRAVCSGSRDNVYDFELEYV